MSRIIAGSRRGHRLTMPLGSTTRPTTDRVREAVFNALVSWTGVDTGPDESLTGLAFLDLFAGSGAVALEAASRGARPVVGVEGNAKVAQVARRNAVSTGLAVQFVTAKVASYLAGDPTPYDLVWLDPPYDLPGAELDTLLATIVGRGWLAPRGLLVVERSARSEPPTWPSSVTEHWNRRYGETSIHYGCEGPS